MKKIIGLCILAVLTVVVSGCGGTDGATIGNAVAKFEDFEKAYNEAAPYVSKLDDASVELYEKAGKIYRTAANACENGFEGYDNEDIIKLMGQMDAQIRIVESLMYKPQEEPNQMQDKNKKTYAMQLQNKTEESFTSVVLKSGSGEYDVTVSIGDSFQPGNVASVSLQAPQNEKFTAVATDFNEKQINFDGTFYLSDKANLELSCTDGKYNLTLVATSKEEKTEEDSSEKKEAE